MKISLNSIKKLTEVKVDIKELEDLIARKIGNVETIDYIGEKYKGILIGQIEKAEAHPDSDILGVYQVNIGDGKVVQVVAGDKSLNVGDKIAYFPVGVKVPYNAHPEKYDGIVREVTLRGVASNGMMAAAKELDISADYEKVLKLDTDVKPGTTFIDAYDLDDYVIDVENKALTNRPECFGLIGMAREISAIQGLAYKTPDWFDYNNEKWTHPLAKNVEKRDGKLVACPRYMYTTMENVQIKDSPVWLQIELMKAGVRPINNVVDITNYLMILTGQPLHAFDMDKVAKDGKELKIGVRKAKSGETITVIDGSTKELDEEVVVITDGESPIAIGGVMGGLNTEISTETKRVVLECANFDMYNIRKTSNRLGIASDAAARYARNQDPQMCEAVMYKLIEMMEDLSGAKLSSKIYDYYNTPREKRKIEISVNELQIKTGLEIDVKDIVKTLEDEELSVEFDGDAKGNENLIVNIPTYRQDLNIAEDIQEEVARLYGFDAIKTRLPQRTMSATAKNPIIDFQSRLRNVLKSLGGVEILTYNFTSAQLLEKAGQLHLNAHKLKNPLSPELEYMRMNLTPVMMEKVAQNIKDGHEEFCLYEINKSHIKGQLDSEKLPFEFRTVCFAHCAVDKVEKLKYSGSAYYMAKKYLEMTLESLKCCEVEYDGMDKSEVTAEIPANIKTIAQSYDQTQSAYVFYQLEGKKYYLGVVGVINEKLSQYLGLPNFTSAFEIDVDLLRSIENLGKKFVPISKYPKVVRDFCFVADKDIPYQIVEATVLESLAQEDMICSVEPVDIYKQKDDDATRQITVRATIQGKDKVLKEKDIEYLHKKVVRAVVQKCGAKLKE